MTDELLDLSDIANLYRVSRRYARDVLVKSQVPDAGIGYPCQSFGQASIKVLTSDA